ncbi:MAG: glycosyltransferase, partial [Planctomycetes bacterium]|nr:glycosyltransferase [Planctomycetota bacterium]
MKVVIFHDWLNGMRGGEKCLEAMLEIFPEAEVYTLLLDRDKLSPAIASKKIHVHPWLGSKYLRNHYRNLLPLFPLLLRNWPVFEQKPDLILSSSHCAAKAFNMRGQQGIPHLCYCYTPMRYIWDMGEHYFGGGGGSLFKRLALGIFGPALRAWDLRSCRGVDRFIAISGFIQERIRRCYGLDSGRVYPFADLDFYTPNPLVPRGDFYLIVSALVPYKRLENLARSVTGGTVAGKSS